MLSLIEWAILICVHLGCQGDKILDKTAVKMLFCELEVVGLEGKEETNSRTP